MFDDPRTPPEPGGLGPRKAATNLARAGGRIQFVLTSYVIERLLYRRSRSTFRDRFVLKGATLFVLWSGYPRRATWDVDLLGYGSPAPAELLDVFRQVFQIEVEDDGLVFALDALDASIIQKDGEYHGVRVKTVARLGSARVRVHVDVGYGDVVDPPAVEQVFPTLLDMPAPLLKAYRPEVTIAEKLEAKLGMANSRLKDYYDIWSLACHGTFDEATLGGAIRGTLSRRRMDLPLQLPLGMSVQFSGSPVKQSQWQGFVRRARARQAPSLEEAVHEVEAFLWPLLERLRMGEMLDRQWPAGGPWQTASSG